MPEYVRIFISVLTRGEDGSSRVSGSSPQETVDNSFSYDGNTKAHDGYTRAFMNRHEGFTLIEMVVTVSLMVILMAMSIGSLSYYLAGKSVDTAITELTTQIREAQSLAVSTGNTYRIDFSDPGSTTYTLQRRSGSEWVNVRSPINLPGGVRFSVTPSFGGSGKSYMEFYARGTTQSGQITVVGRFDKSRGLSVNGETVNVT